MKIISTALLCAVSSCLFGQTDKTLDKQEKPWKEYNQALIQKLTTDLNSLQHELDSLRMMRRQRDMLLNSGSADPASSQQKKKASPKTTNSYASVADLVQRHDWAEDDSLSGVYDKIVQWVESVDSVNEKYDADLNANFKSQIPGVKKAIQGLSPKFKESFEELANQIESFQYAIPELEQAKKRVDRLNFESLPEYIAELDKNYEIEFVKMIPYTLKQLNAYIEHKIQLAKDNAEQEKRDAEAQRRRREGDSEEVKKDDGDKKVHPLRE